MIVYNQLPTNGCHIAFITMPAKRHENIISLEVLKNYLKAFIDTNLGKCELTEHQETSLRNIIDYKAIVRAFNKNAIHFSIDYSDQYADFSLSIQPSTEFPSANNFSYNSDCVISPELNELLLTISSGQLIVEEYQFFNKTGYYRGKFILFNRAQTFNNFNFIQKILFMLLPQKPIKTFKFEPY